MRVMRFSVSVILFVCALGAVLFSLFGDDSYGHLQALKKTLDVQRAKNEDLERKVLDQKSHLRALKSDSRALEKAARNELLMARPDELIFIFDEQGHTIEKQLGSEKRGPKETSRR